MARVRDRQVTPGALLAVTIWIAASFGFSFYVQNFGKYSQAYGSMGAIIVLLFYFFPSAAVLLWGAEVNAIIARESDDTTGTNAISDAPHA